MSNTPNSRRGHAKHKRASRRDPSRLDVSRLEERDVPATFSGIVFLDTNANGRFDNNPTTINATGAGTTPLTTEVGWSGLAQPWDAVASRVPVTVQAFDGQNTVQGQATTGLDGTYTLTVSAAGAYRLEFSNLPTGVSFGPSGQQIGTALQTASVAANANTPGNNLGLVRYEDITPDNPLLASSVYVFGAFNNPDNSNRPVVQSYPYNSGSTIPVPNPPGQPPRGQAGPFADPTIHTISIPHSQVGATWGLAYNRATDQLYMSAFTKGHSGYGPGGPGAIYVSAASPIAPSAFVTTATQFVNLEALAPGSTGRNFRAEAAYTNTANTGGTDPYVNDAFYIDSASGSPAQVGWDAVGKSGLGGLANDPSGRYLFTVALGDRRLYIIDTRNPTAPPTAVNLPVLSDPATGYTGITPTNPLGDLRPFAVTYYRGSIYVGATNTAEATTLNGTVQGDRSRLRAYVFEYKLNFDAAGNPNGTGGFVDLSGNPSTTSAVFDVPLNYQRGYVHPGINDPSETFSPISANWLPWSPVFHTVTNAQRPGLGIYPQPWLTGLAFDDAGNMVLGIRDRSGDQFGVQTPKDLANPTILYVGIGGGDTLRAFADPRTAGAGASSRWTLESNGRNPAGTLSSANGVGNGQGPGGGEFYSEDYLVPGIDARFQDHQELSVGGVLQLPGYQDVAVTSFDPAQVSERYNAGGVRWYRNLEGSPVTRAGDAVRAYELYFSDAIQGQRPLPTFAKANGIGGLVAIRQAPMEIGNKVFLDQNRDGRQDPTDPGLANVVVVLYQNALPIGTATTDANGNYYFTSLTDPGAANRVGGKAYGINVRPNSPYEVRIPLGQTVLQSLSLTTANVNGNSEDQRDSDALAAVGDGVVALTTGAPGTNTHTFDAGFVYNLSLGDFVWEDRNNDGTWQVGEAALPGVTVQLLDQGNAVLATTTTNSQGGYLFTGLNPGTYRVQIPLAATVNPGLQGFRSSTGAVGAATGFYEPADGVPVQRANNADSGVTQPQSGGVVVGPLVNVQPGLAPLLETATANGDLGLVDSATDANSYRDQDFGFFRPTVPPPPPPPAPGLAEVSGYVYVDANINGVRDPGERPIPGTRIYLNGASDAGNPVTATALTNSAGFYRFAELPPGNYVVREQQPDGSFYDGLDTVGTVNGTSVGAVGNDILRAIRLNADNVGVNYNFGEIPNAATFGYVWFDANLNGVFDSGEAPIPGVAVTISGTAFPGTPFARPLTASDVLGGLTVLTNSVGRYDFPALPYGVYNLAETQPIDFDDWQEQDGAPDGPRPTVTNDLFSNVALTAVGPIRGPFNFGETLGSANNRPPVSPLMLMSKRQLLSSTTTPVTNINQPSISLPVQATPGVVASVANLPLQPRFAISGDPSRPAFVATGAGAGTSPLVRVFDYSTGLEKFRFLAFEQAYTGGVRTAVGDVNGDGIPDIVVATGLGGGPRVRAFSGLDGSVLQDFFAYEPTYTGGLSVATGDVNGDGVEDIITGTDVGGGPRVRVFSGVGGTILADFFAFDATQRGGVRVAAADLNKDGRADVIASTGAGVPTRVRVFDGATFTAIRDFAPYRETFTGGVFVSAGDINGDGTPDIVTGADAGGGPQVNVFDGLSGANLTSFFAFEPSFTGGARVAAVDLNGDGRAEIVTAAGSGGGARVTVYSGAGISAVDDFFAFDATQRGGVSVGAGIATKRLQPSTGRPLEAGNLGKPGTLADLPSAT